MFVEKLLDMITSTECCVCGVEGLVVCIGCQQDMQNTAISSCYRCNQLTQDFKTCQACRNHTYLRRLWAVSNYEEPISGLIKSLKFDSQRHIAKPLAQMMSNRLPLLGEGYVIVASPTSLRRKRQRGFDQADLLARLISSQRRIKNLKVLIRIGDSRQVGSNRQKRLDNSKNMFRAVNVEHVRDKRILLIDDVVTTGATLTAAADTLINAGAKSIEAIVMARD